MKAIDTWERVLIALIVLVYVVFGLGIHGATLIRAAKLINAC